MSMTDKEAAKLVRDQTKYDKAREAEINTALNALMTSQTGRTFLSWLMKITGHGENPYLRGYPPEETAFRCGELNVGQQLDARMLVVNPDAYAEMMKETIDGSSTSPRLAVGPDDATGPDYAASDDDYNPLARN